MSRKPHKLLSIKLKATKKTTSQKKQKFYVYDTFLSITFQSRPGFR